MLPLVENVPHPRPLAPALLRKGGLPQPAAVYCLLVFEVLPTEQHLIPGLLRALLRQPEFRTRRVRMGKVARISKGRIQYWEHSSQEVRHIEWKGTSRRKRQ